MTASEPLSIEEEHANQRSWRESRDKLTFIVCTPLPTRKDGGQYSASGNAPVRAGIDDAEDKMVGDVNLFIHRLDSFVDEQATALSKVEGGGTTTSGERGGGKRKKITSIAAEIDVMIASPSNRGKGIGKATVSTFLGYVMRNLEGIIAEYSGACAAEDFRLEEFIAKIHASNVSSHALFKSLGFVQRGDTNYFGELEMVLKGIDRGAILRLLPDSDYREDRYFEN